MGKIGFSPWQKTLFDAFSMVKPLSLNQLKSFFQKKASDMGKKILK